MGHYRYVCSCLEDWIMNTYETVTTVAPDGEVRLAAVPFSPGTEVRVVVSPQIATDSEEPHLAARARMQELFRTVTGFRMGAKIPREDLYDRGSVR
jgi:hypothetical protein